MDGHGSSLTPLLDVDPFCTAFFEDPYPAHAALRDAGSVCFLPQYDCFAVARHAEVQAVLHDHAGFSSGRGVGHSDFAKEPPWRPPSILLEPDPPYHNRTRAVAAKVLSPAAMRRMRDAFEVQAVALVGRLLDAGGECDGIADLAEAFPLRVFPDAVGLQEEGREHLLPYGSLAFDAFGPDNALRRAALATGGPHVAWVTAQCQRDALKPGGLGAAVFEAAEETGDLSPQEAGMLVRSMLTAGLDTTVHAIGAALLCLMRDPESWEALRRDPARVARPAFEEAVRLESPIQAFFRTTSRPVEIGGASLPEGVKVLMFLGAANRDPRRWEEPDRYVLSRKTAGHVGFGSGIHVCVGAALSRLEAETILGALARRVARLEQTGPAVLAHNNTLRGLARLPIRLHAA